MGEDLKDGNGFLEQAQLPRQRLPGAGTAAPATASRSRHSCPSTIALANSFFRISLERILRQTAPSGGACVQPLTNITTDSAIWWRMQTATHQYYDRLRHLVAHAATHQYYDRQCHLVANASSHFWLEKALKIYIVKIRGIMQCWVQRQ